MSKVMIGDLERMLIAECVKDIPSFKKINRLFCMGANPNAVNEYGECVLAIVFEGYCSLYGTKLRSGFFAPHIVACFMSQGFNARRHGNRVISELQNGVYDRYIRQAIKMILQERKKAIKRDVTVIASCIKVIPSKIGKYFKPTVA